MFCHNFVEWNLFACVTINLWNSASWGRIKTSYFEKNHETANLYAIKVTFVWNWLLKVAFTLHL